MKWIAAGLILCGIVGYCAALAGYAAGLASRYCLLGEV